MSQRVIEVRSTTQRMFPDGLSKKVAAEAGAAARRLPSTAARATRRATWPL
jgi:hypothetical protein